MVHQLASKLFDVLCEERLEPWPVYLNLSEGDNFARVFLDGTIAGTVQQTDDGDLTVVLVKSPLQRQIKCSLKDVLSVLFGPELPGFKESTVHVACLTHVPVD